MALAMHGLPTETLASLLTPVDTARPAVTPPARVSASLERYSTGFDPDRQA